MRAVGKSPTEAQINTIISEIDPEGRGSIDFKEFLNAMGKDIPMFDNEKDLVAAWKVFDSFDNEKDLVAAWKFDNEKDLVVAWKVFDSENKGFVTTSHLRHVLASIGEKLSTEELDDLCKESDPNSIGKIERDGDVGAKSSKLVPSREQDVAAKSSKLVPSREQDVAAKSSKLVPSREQDVAAKSSKLVPSREQDVAAKSSKLVPALPSGGQAPHSKVTYTDESIGLCPLIRLQDVTRWQKTGRARSAPPVEPPGRPLPFSPMRSSSSSRHRRAAHPVIMQKPLHVGEVMDGRRRLGTSANARHIGSGMASPEALNAASARPGGNERLYDTFRDLYCFKQASDKNFPSPAIVVLGTQGDGKSALLDSFMGFHLQGPGDQELRRPLTIQCKQNPSCTQPTFHLVNDDGSESEMSLESLREYLAEENARLESVQSYWSKELEAVARSKMEQEDMKIVCVEGSKQWSDSHTLKLVLQVDPLLSRTVLVTMNLDWGSLSISSSSDVDGLLHPTGLDPAIECSPFLVSLPECCLSGHVSGFPSDLQFQQSVSERDAKDLKEIEAKIGRRLDRAERSPCVETAPPISRGTAVKELFRSMALSSSHARPGDCEYTGSVADGLDAAQEELCTWQLGNLKVRARTCVEDFLSRLMLLMRGSVIASPEVFGQTLLDEHICGGKFSYPGGKSLDASATLPDAKMRLLGGAQFHRAMDEFRQVVGGVQCQLRSEEIANACGLEDFHDGANYMRTACTIAVTKAQALFEPFLQQLGFRLAYILRRLLPIAMQLLQKGNQAAATGHEALFRCVESEFYGFINKAFHLSRPSHFSPQSPQSLVTPVTRGGGSGFIIKAEKSCKSRCLEDLRSTTRFVTWSLHNNGQRDMKAMLSKVHSVNAMVGGPGGGVTEGVEDKRENLLSMAEVLEDALWKRQLTSTSEEIVGLLVCQTFNGIRDYIVQAAELKFNCFFLMKIIDAFPTTT
eukprot:gene24458-10058_t